VTLHVHLDPVGGISGDMFAAAMLDAFPDLESALTSDLAAAGVLEHVRISHARGSANGLAARVFTVEPLAGDPRPTEHYREIRALLQASALDAAVRGRAITIFDLLADAEAAVHGVARDDVHFHEIADWDSIADVVTAASLIERCGARSWSCSSVPVGHGLVNTAHGLLPLPAPAAARLLEGFATHVDEHPGERATPTGAAILRHLMANNTQPRPAGTLARSGTGCGTRRFEGLPNVLRALVLQAQAVDAHRPLRDQIGVVAFEVDDMTPEELAVALDRLRACAGVVDASHQTRFGKKGRTQFAVQLLCEPQAVEAVAAACFTETSTLGLRVDITSRLILRRSADALELEGARYPVKRAFRPDASVTAKVESDALASLPGLHSRRAIAATADSPAAAGANRAERATTAGSENGDA
jgi:uncharacterized protein (TIGR00299 family) protein